MARPVIADRSRRPGRDGRARRHRLAGARRATRTRWPRRSTRRWPAGRRARAASARGRGRGAARATRRQRCRRRRSPSIAELLGLSRILVIRLGALGDFVQSLRPVRRDPRAPPAEREIALLTTRAVRRPRAARAVVRRVSLDRCAGRPGGICRACAGCARRCAGSTSSTTCRPPSGPRRYFRLAGRPPWSGIAPRLLAPPRQSAARPHAHASSASASSWRWPASPTFPAPDLSWLDGRPVAPRSRRAYALLVPGAAPHRPAKRWPAARSRRWRAAARRARPRAGRARHAGGAPLAAAIAAACPAARRPDRPDQPAGSRRASPRRAALAVGNDTGPMHLAAAIGCPCVVLFSAASDPALTAPRGPAAAGPPCCARPIWLTCRVDRVAAALP